jgi:hypothetical protein
MKYRIIAIAALIFALPLHVFAGASGCKNTSDGKLMIDNGRLICKLYFEEPITEPRVRFVVQKVRVESDLNYQILELFSQLASNPNEVTLPKPQAVKVSLIIGGKALPIDLDVQPKYKIKSDGSICQLKVIDFEPRVSNLKSSYLPSWLAQSLQNYINKEPRLKKDAIAKALQVLPQIQSFLGGHYFYVGWEKCIRGKSFCRYLFAKTFAANGCPPYKKTFFSFS